MQRFGVLYSKFEIAVQDAIKTPQAKARLSRDTFAMKAYFSGEMDFSGLPRNSLVKSLVVRRNRWHLYQDSGAESKWRRIYDGRERLAPQLSHLLAPARRTARKQVIPSGVQSFRFGDG